MEPRIVVTDELSLRCASPWSFGEDMSHGEQVEGSSRDVSVGVLGCVGLKARVTLPKDGDFLTAGPIVRFEDLFLLQVISQQGPFLFFSSRTTKPPSFARVSLEVVDPTPSASK